MDLQYIICTHGLAIAEYARLVDFSSSIRREVSLGFDAEPYIAAFRHRALRQHPRLADAVIAGNPVLAGDSAASRFSLTESVLAGLHARISRPMPVARLNDIELNYRLEGDHEKTIVSG